MESTNKTNENCDCTDGCCKPKSNRLWTKIVFFVIVAAAISIVTFKMVAKNDKTEAIPPSVTTAPKAKPACGDTTQPNICTKVGDQSNDKPCCPQAKK